MADEITIQVLQPRDAQDSLMVYASTEKVSAAVEAFELNPSLDNVAIQIDGLASLVIPYDQARELFLVMGQCLMAFDAQMAAKEPNPWSEVTKQGGEA
jgi:hypothetical protein